MITQIQNKEHLVQKRDGRLEKFNIKKLSKAINWTTNNNKYLTEELLNSINLKIYDKIKIEKLWDEVISTAANKISEIQPIWDSVAMRAYILKIYKETYNLNSDTFYPDYSDVIKKGVSVGVYDREIMSHFSDEEIAELGKYLQPERDLKYTFIGITTHMDKNAFNYSLTKKLELPQHVYMRLAMFAFHKEKDKLQKIKDRYDMLSDFDITEASPKMLNSMTSNTQMASCVISTADDNTININDTDSNLAVFSKFGGGLSCDVSYLRCSSSPVGKMGGKSSGPIQFIKKFESTVNAFDQMGKRKGSCIISFPFWHYDVKDLIMLKDAGGSDDKRARKMQYAVKWYRLLNARIKNNEDITLFDPKDTPELNQTWGEEFNKWYKHYEDKAGIRKRKMPARELAFLIAKVRSETGNVYITFVDNINEQQVGELPVFCSNLCQEITLPSFPAKNYSSSVSRTLDGKFTAVKTYTPGEIALCNLTSINLEKWMNFTYEEKMSKMMNLLEASDNLIDYQFYPVIEGEISNKTRRPIGIGINNYANYLALNKVKFTDKEAERLTHEIMEDITYIILKCSNQLAKIRGPYEYFKLSNWAKGLLPIDLYKMKDNSDFNYELKHDWETLREDIKKYGVRFSYHFAIAPTATSGVIINSTEGVEPTKKLFQMKEGTYTTPQIVPNLIKNRPYYVNAFDIPNKTINKLASIRQKFLDQSQSVSHYYAKTDSAYEVISDIINAEEVGMKTCYYLTPMKAGDMEGCESCSS